MPPTSAKMPDAHAADADLIARTRAGDPSALAALYRSYGPAVLTVALRLLASHAEAEDVLHDLFVGLPEALRRFEDRGLLGAWLKRVAARMALMRLRSTRRRAEVDLTAASDVALRDEGSRADTRAALEAAIRSLSPALRTVFVLREIEGLTHQEIADMLQISTSASEARLSRATSSLRARLAGSR
jgi:RNA polymerase sigma-70 factor (ECF subfamily)